jgi:hypothetical protein
MAENSLYFKQRFLMGPQGQSLKAQGGNKKHAFSGKMLTTVLYATSPRSSQDEVPNSLTIRVGVQGRMTRNLNCLRHPLVLMGESRAPPSSMGETFIFGL